MIITYKPNKLGKTVANLSAIKKNYGTMAKDVNTRINELTHATSLEDMRFLPQANCHELFQNLEGHLAVDVSVNHRIIFKPANDPIPLKTDGGLDWTKVTEVTIIEIAYDYHKK
ncbi:MAG: killer suppression protein HigA [Bacteroidota bacterium]|nr:killer suppression protein HigA [Bacteroidota bacterium]